MFEKIAEAANEVFNFPVQAFYYVKSNNRPSIPQYYVMELGGAGMQFALQIYAVFDPALISLRKFLLEPSFIVVAHSRPDLKLYISQFGLSVIGDSQIEITATSEGIVSGMFKAGVSKGERFHAFQMPFDSYLSGADVKQSIQREFVDVLKKLPAF